MNKGTELVEQYRDDFDRQCKLETLKQVIEFRAQNGLPSVAEACRELDIDYRKLLSWIDEGVFSDYQRQRYDIEVAGLLQQIMNAMPGVISHMIKIASGMERYRGANPVAATQVLTSLMDRLSPEPELVAQPKNGQPDININVFTPREYHIPVTGNSPQINSQRPAITVDAKEIEEGD